MDIFNSLLFYFPNLAFKRSALPALEKLVSKDIASKVWKKTLEQQKKLALKRPSHSLGTNHVLRYMEWDCALYFAALEAGIAEPTIKKLIENINWAAFGPMNKTIFLLSRFRSNTLITRVKWVVDLMFLFVFTSPFKRNVHPSTSEVAFDVVVCPFANYFKEQGVANLTSSAVCSLDHQMANLWGVQLSRTQTIAEGHQFCNFRFHKKI